MSTRRLGSPTCWPACRITPPSAFTNSCPGTGTGNTSPPKLLELIGHQSNTELPYGLRRMDTSERQNTLNKPMSMVTPYLGRWSQKCQEEQPGKRTFIAGLVGAA